MRALRRGGCVSRAGGHFASGWIWLVADKQGAVKLFGHHTWLQLADPPIGVLLVLARAGAPAPRPAA